MEDKLSYPKFLKLTGRLAKDSLRANKSNFILLITVISLLAIMPFLSNLLTSKWLDALIQLVATGTSTFVGEGVVWFLLASASQILQNVLWAVEAAANRSQYFEVNKYFTFTFLDKISALDIEHHEDPTTKNMIEKARDAYGWKPANAANSMVWTLSNLIGALTSMFIILLFSPIMFIVIVITTLPSLIVSIKLTDAEWTIWEGDSEVRRKFGSSTNLLEDNKSIMEIRIFQTRNYLINFVKNLFDSFDTRQKKQATKKAFWESMSTLTSKGGLIVFTLYAIYAALEGQITIGLLTFYGATAAEFSNSLEGLFRNTSRVYEGAKFMQDYYALAELPVKVVSGNTKLKLKTEPPQIVFDNVSFIYPNSKQEVLKNLRLTIEPGEKVAFVGENGAGKTTLIKLLSRFYDATAGSILIDGVDLKSIDLDTWYPQLGVLFQEFVRYEFLTVAENIGLGDAATISDKEKVKLAAQMANADKMIEGLKDKYDQMLGKSFEKGVELSGGQWQRIALARGFFRNAPVLVLDEPTSAIDAEAEFKIFENLFEHAQGKTVIIVSHRFSTVRKADRIFVLADGELIEQGTHEELIVLGGTYSSAFAKQAQGYK
jgi:ATP-binding cassette subfamily B protein